MTATTTNPTIVTIRAHVRPDATVPFIDWQTRLNARIAAFPGFVSLEILSASSGQKNEWMIVQRFQDQASIKAWCNSSEYNLLLEELKAFLTSEKPFVESSEPSQIQGCITEVFVTQVSPDKEEQYREWMARIHQAEAKFPGFRGTYVQSPTSAGKRNWITLLQFDTPENLDRWLSSPERAKILEESKPLIASLESHRVISPFAGWFSSITAEGKPPARWKQTMIVLLVLFPIVMLEMRFLNPLLAGVNISLATFIGNAISVSLVAWPLVPLAIKFLRWWLVPTPEQEKWASFVGTVIVLALYLVEVTVLWRLL